VKHITCEALSYDPLSSSRLELKQPHTKIEILQNVRVEWVQYRCYGEGKSPLYHYRDSDFTPPIHSQSLHDRILNLPFAHHELIELAEYTYIKNTTAKETVNHLVQHFFQWMALNIYIYIS
jgi:hypothetical protein